MYENMLFVPESRVGLRAWALPLSLTLHAVVAAALITIPLLRPLDPPRIEFLRAFLAPSISLPLPPPPPPLGKTAGKKIGRRSPSHLPRPFAAGKMFAPVEIPSGFDDEWVPDYGIDGGVSGGIDGGVKGGIYGGVLGDTLEIAVGEVIAPVRAVGDVKPPRLIKRVDPVYPEIARESRSEGIVIIEARTDIYGRVASLRLLRSVPLLDDAAMDAVRQWIYEPMIINGRPRDVVFTVTVRFVLK